MDRKMFEMISILVFSWLRIIRTFLFMFGSSSISFASYIEYFVKRVIIINKQIKAPFS